MKFSTLLVATLIVSAPSGAAFAQQTSVSPTNQAVPGSVNMENNAETDERDAVAAGTSAMGETIEPMGGKVDATATGSIEGYNQDPTDLAVPGSDSLEENAEARECLQIAQ